MSEWKKLVGKRVLITKAFPSRESVFEVKILEVSPSGERFKMLVGKDYESWSLASDYRVVEVLGTPSHQTWAEFVRSK